MTAGSNGKGMQGVAMALCDVMVRPTATLRRISDNPATYLASSVAILVALVVLGALFPITVFGPPMREIAWDGALYALVTRSVDVLLLILGIFWIGRRWGGTSSLRRAFPALAYCVVPVLLGIVTLRAAWGLYDLAVPEPIFHDGLARTTLFDFAGGSIQHAVGLLPLGWTLLLHLKAIRVLNGFGYARSAAILALAVLIVYAANMAQAVTSIAISELVLLV